MAVVEPRHRATGHRPCLPHRPTTERHRLSPHLSEEKILRLHQTKRNLADAMLEGTNESHKLTSKDLLAMIDKDS